MKKKCILGLALGASLLSFSLSAQDRVQDTRAVLDRWVTTKQLISREQNDWRLEQSILEDTRTLLNGQLQDLNKVLAEMTATASAADQERSQLTADKAKLKSASAAVANNIGSLESQIKALIPSLPAPLIEKIKPLIRRLPDAPDNTQLSMAERVQNIIGILSQADQFNSTITLSTESREIVEGKFIQVTTLYWGLATAYFVDTSGEYAGIGQPSDTGWVWNEVPGSGQAITQFLNIYESSEDIQFVELPASIR